MAGFADEIQHFNPYIPQMPVDDYINAGMMLQQRYNEGVAKTQSAIDNVAGVQVAGEANTQYLRSKVSQLESRVTGIASADFAKNSVSSQVGQLAGTIVRDPVIQAGMSSAVRLQKYEKSWEDLKKDHPDQYSDQNKEYFDQYVNDYLKQSQSKAGLVYNGPTDAVAHVNYYDDIDKELKGLDPSITTSISPAGEFMYKIDKNSTISRDQIDGVINSKMLSDPRIQQQMQIDAWHSYRSFDGAGMFDHVTKSFGAMIDNYQQNTKYYQGVIKANPNDYTTVSAAQKKILDFNTEVKTLQTNRDTYLQALNEGKVDDVKQSVFNDSIRQGLILKYERNNITTDLHNNENAIEASKNYFEGKKLDIELAKYKIEEERLMMERFKFKKEVGNDQAVSIPGQVPDEYTQDQHQSAITSVQNDISGMLTKLRGYHSNFNDAEWKQYQDVQEAKYQSGDATVDPKYAQYKSLVQPQQALLNTYQAISDKINGDAAAKTPLGGNIPEVQHFNNVQITEDDGSTHTGNITANRETVQKAAALAEAINSHAKSGGSLGVGSPGVVIPPTKQEVDMEISKYRNDPNFKLIRSLAFDRQIYPAVDAVRDQLGKRQDLIDAAFKDYGKTVSYQARPIVGKKEEIEQLQRLTATAASANGDAIEADKINPVNYYNDEKGQVVIQYQKQKDGKMYQVAVPAARNILGNPDPYESIARVIDLSPTKSTPLDPKQALSSVNGKLKYAIQKDAMSGSYELRIWHKGALYTVPSFSLSQDDSYSAPNIGSYIERVEQLSKLPAPQFEALMKASFGQ